MFLNKKGMTLISLIISISIGIIVILGILKGLGSLKKKAEIVTKVTKPSFARQIVSGKLRDDLIWDATIKKTGGKIPGKNTGIVLYNSNGSGPWVCRLKGGGINRGVVITSRLGQPQKLNCGRCRSDLYCGFPKDKFSRIELTVTPNDNLRPAFKAVVFDTSTSKKKSSFSVASTSEELFDEKQASCENEHFLIKIVDGKPICEDTYVAIKNTTWCNNTSYLTGFTNEPKPICTPVAKHGQDIVNRDDQRINDVYIRVNKVIAGFRSYATINIFNQLGTVNNYYNIRGSNDDECASLKRMTCRPGFMMFAYEALNEAPASDHCSLQCRKISPFK